MTDPKDPDVIPIIDYRALLLRYIRYVRTSLDQGFHHADAAGILSPRDLEILTRMAEEAMGEQKRD